MTEAAYLARLTVVPNSRVAIDDLLKTSSVQKSLMASGHFLLSVLRRQQAAFERFAGVSKLNDVVEKVAELIAAESI